MPDSEPQNNVKRPLFRDPAAITTLQKISRGLLAQGYDVSEPKVGKACHGFCRVAFKNVEISVLLFVERCEAKIKFEVMTWPSQSFRQRMKGRRMTQPDCEEWAELATAIRIIVARDFKPETVTLRTFAEADTDN